METDFFMEQLTLHSNLTIAAPHWQGYHITLYRTDNQINCLTYLRVLIFFDAKNTPLSEVTSINELLVKTNHTIYKTYALNVL